MTTVEVLRNARALIEDPAHWMQGGWFWDDQGRMCASGACIKAVDESSMGDSSRPARRALAATAGDPLAYGPAQFNDSHSHAEVLDLFDRTIKRLEDQS